jgi:adenylate cyclase
MIKTIGRGPSRISSKFCSKCQVESSKYIGGSEIDLTLLFADVRGSTSLAEGMNPSEFSRVISRFFGVSSKILLKSGAWVDRLVGDQVIGMYIPFYVGENHQQAAVKAAKALLRATGHDSPDGPWIPLGVGIHCGNAFVGTVGSQDAATDITVLGDAPNTAARLSSAAAIGEIVLSDGAYEIAGMTDDLERRTLELKGKIEPMGVRVLTDLSA